MNKIFTKNNIKKYLKVFLIPTFVFLALMIIGSDDIKDFFNSFVEMGIIIIVWAIISIPITMLITIITHTKLYKTFVKYKTIIFIIISIIIFITIKYYIIIEKIYTSIIYTFFLLIPTFILILIYVLKKKNKNNKFIKYINIFENIHLIVSFFYILILFFIGLMLFSFYGVNNIINYHRVNTIASIPDVFPKKIPKNAKNIKFSYRTHIFEGNEKEYLYFNSDKTIIDSYKYKYRKKNVDRNKVMNNDISTRLDIDWIMELFNTKLEKLTIIMLEKRCDDKELCKHGEYKIIFINERDNSILFTFERW